jgi:hypothetical protein
MSTLLVDDSLQWLPIASIEPDGTEECICISVSDPSRCYITASGIVTHNSDTSSPVERLPEKPSQFVEQLLAGESIADAAKTAGLPVERVSQIKENIGKFLANEFTKDGITDPADAIRQLAQYGTDRALNAAPKRAQVFDKTPSTLAAISFNHADRWLHAKLAGLSEKAGLPQMLAKLVDNLKAVPFFGQAIEILHQQAMPLEHIPTEAMALWREMQMKQAFGAELALDVHRSLDGKAKFTDIAYPEGFASDPHAKKQLYLYMTGELDGSKVSPEMHDLSLRLRKLLMEAGEEAVKQGRMSPDTLSSLQETYLPHYYEVI